MILLLWLWASLALAVRQLKTSALLSCQEHSQVQASSFNLVFFPENNTAVITTTMISSLEGNFSADIHVEVYGLNIFQKTITNCEISDTICPMSAGHFDVDTTYKLPDDVIKDVPGIAYTMPDIDAVVRVTVRQMDENGNIGSSTIACVEAQVSNTKTVQTPIASWILFGLIVFFLLIAGIMGLRGYYSTTTHITADIMALFGYFQSIAIIGMMAVERLPPIAAAWVQNFMWTMGIMRANFIQTALSWYIRSTGGRPSVIISNKQILSIAVYKRSKEILHQTKNSLISFVRRAPEDVWTSLGTGGGSGLVKRVISSDQQYVTTNENDPSLVQKTLVLQGMKRVAFLANVEISNLFLTGAVFFIFIGMVLVLIMFAVKLLITILVRTKSIRHDRFLDFRQQWGACTKGVMNRYFLIGFSQLTVLCLYEFMQRNSVACVVDAAFMYAVVLITLVWSAIKVIMLARESTKLFKNPAYILYRNSEILNHWGFMYVQFRATAYYFLVPLMVANFVRSAVIALGQQNGKVQAVIIFALELIYLVVVCVLRPYMDKKTNGINIAVAVVMFLNSIMFLLFSQIFPHTRVASPIAAVVFFILNAIFSLILVLSIIVSCLWAIFRKDPDARYQPMKDDRAAFRHDAHDGESNELADMAEAARDGYRESYIHNDERSIYRDASNPSNIDKEQANYRPYNGGFQHYN